MTVVKIKNKTGAQLGCSFPVPMTALKIRNQSRAGLFFCFLSFFLLSSYVPSSRSLEESHCLVGPIFLVVWPRFGFFTPDIFHII
jgi:hypothetical protein